MPRPTQVFSTSTQRTAWSIAAKHLARGQKDPVPMVQEGIEYERKRCIELLHSSGMRESDVPIFLKDPDADW